MGTRKLWLFCGLVMVAFLSATYFSRSLSWGQGGTYREQNRKGGDLWVGGSHYHGRSGRMGSQGNRSFRGGGVRGGK